MDIERKDTQREANSEEKEVFEVWKSVKNALNFFLN